MISKLAVTGLVCPLVNISSIARAQDNEQHGELLDGTISAAQAQTKYTFSQGFPIGDTESAVIENQKLRGVIEAYKTWHCSNNNML